MTLTGHIKRDEGQRKAANELAQLDYRTENRRDGQKRNYSKTYN